MYGASPQIGVSGLASATSGASYGVNGRSNSSSGYGVYGYAAATTGATSGVYGLSDSSVGHGVTGEATAGSGTGVFGVTDTTNGAGVFGFASAGSGNASGVIGETASSTGLAGYFLGDVNVVGTLSKTAGSFKIDDPLDPAHKYLQHSFVESPDMMNVYNGNVTLDDNGKAVVTMPDWFQALNQDFRYQLTAIGGPGPNLYVAEKMKDNQFRIAGGEPGMEVSWLVTGIRHDPYAEAHRVQVVVDKPADEQGTYLFPSLYDQPTSKGLQSTAQAGLNAGSVPPAGQAPTLSRQALPDEQVPSGSLP